MSELTKGWAITTKKFHRRNRYIEKTFHSYKEQLQILLGGWRISLTRKSWQNWSCLPREKEILPVHTSILRVGMKRMGWTFSVAASNRIRDNVYRVKHRKFYLNIRKTSLLWGWQSTGTRLPRHPRQHILDKPALAGVWTRWSPAVPFNPKYSVSLWFCYCQ